MDEKHIFSQFQNAVYTISEALRSLDPAVIESTSLLLFARKLDYHKDSKQIQAIPEKFNTKMATAFLIFEQFVLYSLISYSKNHINSPIDPISEKSFINLPNQMDQTLKAFYYDQTILNIMQILRPGQQTLSILNEINQMVYDLLKYLTQKPGHNDILGKFFQRLIPKEIRKHLSVFYTSNAAAKIMAMLSIQTPADKILDLACGSGTLLVESYKYKKFLLSESEKEENSIHKRLLSELYGNDVLFFASHLACLNLALQSVSMEPGVMQMYVGDGFRLIPGNNTDSITIPPIDAVLMNPPFTRHERVADDFSVDIMNILESAGYGSFLSAKMSLQHFFLIHSSQFLRPGGRLAFILPTNSFNVGLTERITAFLKKYKIHIEYVLSINSNKGTFSEDCNFKEYIIVATKGTLNASSATKLVMLSALPDYQDNEDFVQQIKNTQEEKQFSIGSCQVVVKMIQTAMLYASTRWDMLFWDLDHPQIMSVLSSPCLVPLKQSPEFTFFTGFHSTHCEYLIVPNELFIIGQDLGDRGIEVQRTEDQEKVIIPKNLIQRTLREPKFYQNLYTEPIHWVINVTRNQSLPPDFKNKFIDYTTNKLSEIVKKKAQRGGKVKGVLGPYWYCHPHETGCETKTGHLWTFNRYGLWLRQNAAFFTEEEVTGNDGFHIYHFHGNGSSENALQILNCWFNSSIHLYDFLRKCRVPAAHVQQVLKNDRAAMVVPLIAKIPAVLQKEILLQTKDFAESVSGVILDQIGQEPRKILDRLWLKILGIPEEKWEIILTTLYNSLHLILQNR